MTTTRDISNAISSRVGVSRAVARDCAKAFVEAVTGALLSGQTVKVDGLGVFMKVTRGARRGRDPRNAEPIDIPERRDVKFRAAADLKEKL